MPNITQNKAWKPTTRFSNKITGSLAENMEWWGWMANYNGLRRKKQRPNTTFVANKVGVGGCGSILQTSDFLTLTSRALLRVSQKRKGEPPGMVEPSL